MENVLPMLYLKAKTRDWRGFQRLYVAPTNRKPNPIKDSIKRISALKGIVKL